MSFFALRLLVTPLVSSNFFRALVCSHLKLSIHPILIDTNTFLSTSFGKSYILYDWSYEFESHTWRGVLETTLCDKVGQWLATGRWFSPVTPVSSTNKTDRQDITKILLKVALNTITITTNILYDTITTSDLYPNGVLHTSHDTQEQYTVCQPN
jgi:hypothetical protein